MGSGSGSEDEGGDYYLSHPHNPPTSSQSYVLLLKEFQLFLLISLRK